MNGIFTDALGLRLPTGSTLNGDQSTQSIPATIVIPRRCGCAPTAHVRPQSTTLGSLQLYRLNVDYSDVSIINVSLGTDPRRLFALL